MGKKLQNEKIILGLKIRKLRTEKELSFAKFSELTGLSTSYLNEIEKGKKFPKEDKIKIIAKALSTDKNLLISNEIPTSLTPIQELLKSNFLNELPLDLFGLDLAKVIEMMAGAPSKVGAFIATLVNLSRNYALVEENFYFGALRSYLEMHNNYFDEIEKEVESFCKTHAIASDELVAVDSLQKILEEKYRYEILDGQLKNHPELKEVRSLFLKKKKQFLLNSELTNPQRAFQLGKEIGFNHLKLKERAMTSSLIEVNSFEEVLNHFKAGYFSAALLINRQSFIEDLNKLFSLKQWNGDVLLKMLEKYDASPEMIFQRMTNVIPEFFDVKNIFFLRSIYNSKSGKFRINRELHINKKHPPHSNDLKEHYCRRWKGFSLLKKLNEQEESILIDIQNEIFIDSEPYLSITVAAKSNPDKYVSVTLGILKDAKALEEIKFLKDPNIPTKIVGTTCQRCPISDCKERVAPPTIIDKKEKLKKVKEAIERIKT